jgi:hypothetical protein
MLPAIAHYNPLLAGWPPLVVVVLQGDAQMG